MAHDDEPRDPETTDGGDLEHFETEGDDEEGEEPEGFDGPEEEPGQTYTQQDVVSQSLVAFGQGTHFMRVSSRACRVLVAVMENLVLTRRIHENWGTEAVQILERVRLIGRVAASLAVKDARTVVEEADVRFAVPRVQIVSKTDRCGPDPKKYP
ncbi:MAG: hypothetical protein AAGD06_27860 [Acidobacteriota bacterium]